jgi:hypothetical protein
VIINNPYASDADSGHNLKLPDLASFEYGPLIGMPAPEESVVSHASEMLPTREESEELWGLVQEDLTEKDVVQLKSWESFLQSAYSEPHSAYISEAGSAAFDAVVKKLPRHRNNPPKVIRSDVFIKSLFSLGLGRSSVLFTYDTGKRDFVQNLEHGTISGYTTETAQGLVSRMMSCGRIVRYLRDYVEKTYTSGSAFAAKVALANAVSSVVGATEQHLSELALTVRTLLQLQQAFERPGRILSEIDDIVKSMKTARSNEDMATFMFERCVHSEQEPDWLRSVLLQIMARVSSPWLEIAEEWIGLREDRGFYFGPQVKAANFVKYIASSDGSNPDDLGYSYHPEHMPSFIAPEDGQMMFEVGQSLRIIRSHHPDHPLARSFATAGSQIPALQWTFNWQTMDSVVEKAKTYERSLAVTIQRYREINPASLSGMAPGTGSLQVEKISQSDSYNSNTFAFDLNHNFDDLQTLSPVLPDELNDIILNSTTQEILSSHSANTVDFAPPIALTPVLSFNPMLTAQSKLVNAASIRLFLRSHNLRTHLSLQRNFHLFGDGVFVSRLTAALFDPDLSTTERKSGVMRSGSGMGLKLGSRSAWPPASSELRLALMGILSESYQASLIYHSQKSTLHQARKSTLDIPGSFSFAIRQLSETEAERIMNPESLYALDFLRLQYSPPSPLGAVITPSSLDRYDAVFKFLLRLSRLLYIVSHLPHRCICPNGSLFRFQAHHFVTRISSYFFDTGVRETWDVFTRYLDSIEERLSREDEANELGIYVAGGIDDLRKQHELCLERITFALLLRKRQYKVMALLEEIFGCILDFAKMFNDVSDGNPASERIDLLFVTFRNKTNLFLDVCKGLVGRKGYGKSGGEERGTFGEGAKVEENMIERLVTMLDYNEFYSKA